MRRLKTLNGSNGQSRRQFRQLRRAVALPRRKSRKYLLITGGAGFIGTNVAHRFLSAGHPVLLYDNFSRPGVEKNVAWLRATHGNLVKVRTADIRDRAALRPAVRNAAQVFHLAAQVAVTSSLEQPVEDFEVNARGTLNLLETLRALPEPPPVIFTSTNKVYGDLGDVRLQIKDGRYEPEDRDLRQHGFDESRPLNFHSPYGCSKGCACQYMLDYTRTFGVPAVAFHMSCIYGLHQFGTEDQGWVAHFLIRALGQQPITIYGDGRQVRDILFVEDLVDAFLLAHRDMDKLAGRAFNVGGGPANTISLLELLDLIGELHQQLPAIRFKDWRSADQRYYVSDIRNFSAATGWLPRAGVREGVARLYQWLKETMGSVPTPASTAPERNGHRPGLIQVGGGRSRGTRKMLTYPAGRPTRSNNGRQVKAG